MTIRIRLKELVAEKEFREGRVVTFKEIAEETGIHRVTLSKIANNKGTNVGTDTLDRLCRYFRCRVEHLAEYVEDDKVESHR